MHNNLQIIEGNSFIDERGIINFVNDFSFQNIKRFYTITHNDISVIRAWQGHKKETKYFFVSKGSFTVCWVTIDDWKNPSKNLIINKQILTSNEPKILTIPKGNASGFKALEKESTLILFSDLTLKESSNDICRFEVNYWKVDW